MENFHKATVVSLSFFVITSVGAGAATLMILSKASPILCGAVVAITFLSMLLGLFMAMIATKLAPVKR